MLERTSKPSRLSKRISRFLALVCVGLHRVVSAVSTITDGQVWNNFKQCKGEGVPYQEKLPPGQRVWFWWNIYRVVIKRSDGSIIDVHRLHNRRWLLAAVAATSIPHNAALMLLSRALLLPVRHMHLNCLRELGMEEYWGATQPLSTNRRNWLRWRMQAWANHYKNLFKMQNLRETCCGRSSYTSIPKFLCPIMQTKSAWNRHPDSILLLDRRLISKKSFMFLKKKLTSVEVRRVHCCRQSSIFWTLKGIACELCWNCSIIALCFVEEYTTSRAPFCYQFSLLRNHRKHWDATQPSMHGVQEGKGVTNQKVVMHMMMLKLLMTLLMKQIAEASKISLENIYSSQLTHIIWNAKSININMVSATRRDTKSFHAQLPVTDLSSNLYFSPSFHNLHIVERAQNFLIRPM